MVEEFLTVKEVSKLLKISKSKLYELVERREIPHYRLGEKGKRGAIRFKLDDVQEWLKERKIESGVY